MTKAYGVIKYGNELRYVNHSGEIFRRDPSTGNVIPPSHECIILGAYRRNNFGKVVEFLPFEKFKKLNGRWRCKNGAQRWFVEEMHYGTKREWVSPRYEVVILS